MATDGLADMADPVMAIVQATAQGLQLPLRSLEIELGPSQVEAVFDVTDALTAADVVYSFQRAVTLNKSPGFILAQFGFTKDNVTEKVKATDDSTLVITVSKPFAPTFFLNCLTSGVASIVDSKLVKANEKDGDWGNGWLKQNSAGSGAYKVRAYRPNEQYTLDANEAWYKGAPKNKRIVVRHGGYLAGALARGRRRGVFCGFGRIGFGRPGGMPRRHRRCGGFGAAEQIVLHAAGRAGG